MTFFDAETDFKLIIIIDASPLLIQYYGVWTQKPIIIHSLELQLEALIVRFSSVILWQMSLLEFPAAEQTARWERQYDDVCCINAAYLV